MTRARNDVRGFSLIELAIVVSVIGLIIGGLWTIAGQTMENMRQHQLTQDITATVDNVRAAYMNKQSIGGIAAQDGTTQALMQNLVNKGTVFPSDMTGGTGKWPNSPWSNTSVGVFGTFNICAWAAASTTCPLDNTTVVGQSPVFAVDVRSLTQANCINAATRDSSSSMPQGLIDVFVNGTSIGPAAGLPMPVQPASSEAQCAAGSANVIDFVYRLNPSSAP